MTQVTISSKNQITLPKKVLQELGLRAGSKLLIKPTMSEIILAPKPKSLTKYFKGSGKLAWQKLGGGEKFIKAERASWR